ncbi:MAG: hypothetical protein NTW14_05125 [bacterium]|nr:hypothetical protein [bacterium]
MHLFKTITISLVLALTWAGIGLCQDEVNQQIGTYGSVNFTDRTIQAIGIGQAGGPGGRAGVIRAGKLDALRNLLEAINGIALTSTSTVENQMLANDVVKTRVEGIARNYRMIGEPRYFEDQSIEVTIEMSLDGPFLDTIFPEKMGGGQPIASARPGEVYTGLIIDATGLDVRPALAPRIVDEDGQEVYGSSFISRDWAIKYGMVGYEKDLKAASANDRVANKPLVAKAVKAEGPNHTDLVISNQDAQTLHGMKDNLSFLEKCRVIIVLN